MQPLDCCRVVRRRQPNLPPLRPVDASAQDPAGGGHHAVALGHNRVAGQKEKFTGRTHPMSTQIAGLVR